MKQATQMINNTQLRQFAPLGQLSDDDSQELLRTSSVVQFSPGATVFNKKDSGKQQLYLIEGKIELCCEGKKIVIEAGTKAARKPIGRHLSGQESAVALNKSVLVSFDADMLDLYLNWTNPSSYVVNEMDSDQGHEWLSRLLTSRGLLRLSEQQINTLLERMNEVHFNKGDVIISQDDDDQFFYIIKQGRAVVSRKPLPDSKDIKLAYLDEGDAFGEESILTNTPRGATVTMHEAGNLMQLSKQDFSELLAHPLLDTVSWLVAQTMDATFLDIRPQEDFDDYNIPGSINTPLPLLRLKLKQLKQNKKYIVYCDNGSRSKVATFLLNQHGFDAYILDGGITAALPDLVMQEIANVKSSKKSDVTETNRTETVERPIAVKHTDDPSAQTDHKDTGQRRSLADYWGPTVESASDENFIDSDSINFIEKTKAIPTIVKTAANTISNKTHMFQEYKRDYSKKISWPVRQVRVNPFTSKKILRSTMLACSAIGIATATAYAMYDGKNERIITATNSTLGVPATPKPLTIQSPAAVIAPASVPESAPEQIVGPAINGSQPQLAEPQFTASFLPETSQEYVLEGLDFGDEELSFILPSPTIQAEEKQDTLDPATRGFIE